MNTGERIKKLRKTLDLTQQKFGERLGIKGNTVAQYELGRSNPVDSVFSLICREFNVNEEWLRNGEGEMFNPAPSDVLDQLADKYKLSNAAYIVVEKFVNLRPEKRKELIDFFMEISKAIMESEADPRKAALPEGTYTGFSEDQAVQIFQHMKSQIPRTPEELERKYPPAEPDRKESGAG